GVLAMMPRVIIFDESTAMLDPAGRREVFDLVKRINAERGITVLWITHFMEEAAQAKRLLVMDRGVIRADAAPRQVFSDTALLTECGLEAPDMTLIAKALRERGFDIRNDILTVEEMVVELCRLKSGT
ncbi:MAG: energy-coupling factor transporter ATPase, partial [Clostridia bacterium]|nr:energy-coupling factor transporter ATPase [Clostridia bacterium]